jgi:methionine sulfoxide reductase heme-binding subunit
MAAALRDALRAPAPATVEWIKAVSFVLALGPLARLVAAGLADYAGGSSWEALSLGVNPIELVTRSTGTWTLVFLLITLAVTPLRRLTGWNWLVRLRRMFGLFAFFYALLHFTTYVWLDVFFDLEAIAKDIVKRPFITVGFAAFVLLIPLAITSTDAMTRRLGGKRWQQLHRLVYAIAVLGVLHYWWLVKRDLTEPIVYATVLAVLLAARVFARRAKRAKGA